MFRFLAPSFYVKSIFEIDLDRLWERGIRGIITDLDNTLIGWNVPEPDVRAREWFERIKVKGFKVCISSNNRAWRVASFVASLGIAAIPRASKPRRRSFREAMEIMGTTPPETVVIGDQIFTDILGGNRAGLMTILVVPLSNREFIGTRLVRKVEEFVIRRLKKRGIRERL